jgi:hypothetical protein
MSAESSEAKKAAALRNPKKFQPKRLHPSIKKERMNPSDYLNYDFRFACEECSHFDTSEERCTLGYQSSHHRKAQQAHDFELSGRMALCRFHEID